MTKFDDLETELYEWARQNAENIGCKLNPDYDIVAIAIKGMANNKKKYGEQYCSCREITGNKEIDRKIICPCVYRSRELEQRGACKCALFVK